MFAEGSYISFEFALFLNGFMAAGCLLTFFRARDKVIAVLTALMIFSVGTHLLNVANGALFESFIAKYLVLLARGLGMMFPLLAYFIFRRLFEDDWRPDRFDKGLIGFAAVFLPLHLLLGNVVKPSLQVEESLVLMSNLLACFLASVGLFRAFREAQANDLIEARREKRFIFLTVMIGLALLYMVSVALRIAVLGGTLIVFGADTDRIIVMNIAAFILSSFLIASAVVLFGPWGRWILANEAGAQGATDGHDMDAALTDVEAEDIARVRKLFEDKKLYRTSQLSLPTLSDLAQIPEYRLRKAINRGMGFRNFNALLNHYRIEDAKAQLTDPNMASIPILTIAHDLGYGSIASFNRVFKQELGVTPGDFRRASLGQAMDEAPASRVVEQQS